LRLKIAVNLSRKSAQATPVREARTRRRGEESGYAYLMALFLVLSMMIGSQVLLRNLITERMSQREQEMIWRGQQYVRAVRVYYRKTGHYPQRQDDLVTGVPGMHFLRAEVMKDPMNKDDDGAWRFIYTNAAGALIGSVKYGSMQQMALMDANGGVMPNALQQGTSALNSASGSPNSTTPAPTTATGPAQSPTGTSFGLGLGTPTPQQGNAPGSALGAGQTLGPLGQPGTPMGAMATPTGPVDGPVIGGQLVGVGSKVDKNSVRVYKGGTKYNEWEFIWNPLEEQAGALQQGLNQQGTGAGLGLGGLPLGPTGALTPGQNGVSLGGAIVTPGGDQGAGGQNPQGAPNTNPNPNPDPNQSPNQNPQGNPNVPSSAPANP
jgi:hypothetical protein